MWVVYVGKGSLHSRQRVEAADEEAHISKDARPMACEDLDETQALGIGHVFKCKVWCLLLDAWIYVLQFQLWVAGLQKLII